MFFSLSCGIWYRADSWTNLIKQTLFFTGQTCGPVAQLAGSSYSMREFRGPSLPRAMSVFLYGGIRKINAIMIE